MARRSNEWLVAIGHSFATHVRDERHVLKAYERLARGTSDPGTRFLLRLILDDEQRHHALFERLGAAAAASGRTEGSAGGAGEGSRDTAPDGGGDGDSDSEGAGAGGAGGRPVPPHPEPETVHELLGQTRDFLELEREDAESLKELAHQLRPGRHIVQRGHSEEEGEQELWHLLVTLMQLDTEKHLRILGYLAGHLEAEVP